MARFRNGGGDYRLQASEPMSVLATAVPRRRGEFEINRFSQTSRRFLFENHKIVSSGCEKSRHQCPDISRATRVRGAVLQMVSTDGDRASNRRQVSYGPERAQLDPVVTVAGQDLRALPRAQPILRRSTATLENLPQDIVVNVCGPTLASQHCQPRPQDRGPRSPLEEDSIVAFDGSRSSREAAVLTAGPAVSPSRD